MNYREALRYLNSFINYERINRYDYNSCFKLSRMERLVELLGSPHNRLRSIHIAGTKGKGSTCAIAASILREAGYKVGLYTSPHLLDFRERIQVSDIETYPWPSSGNSSSDHGKNRDGQNDLKFTMEGFRPISKEKVCELVGLMSPSIDIVQREFARRPISFFEVYTALAFLYFEQEDVEFAVLEVGLGGRLDATNVVRPCVCGITPISLEHTDKLGRTIAQIAAEKAGIIKVHSPQSIVHRRNQSTVHSPQSIVHRRNQSTVHSPHPIVHRRNQSTVLSSRHKAKTQRLPVITATQDEKALEVIRDRCKQCKARLIEVGKDILFSDGEFDGNKQNFHVRGLRKEYPNLRMGLLGRHQIINASVAIGVVESLEDVDISPEQMSWGLDKVYWPGRLEVVSRDPLIIVDGAQNVASLESLLESIDRLFSYKGLILILGLCKDKDISGMCSLLTKKSDHIILTKAQNPRAAEPELIRSFMDNHKVVSSTQTVCEALRLAKEKSSREDLILVTGSLFVVGEAMEALDFNLKGQGSGSK